MVETQILSVLHLPCCELWHITVVFDILDLQGNERRYPQSTVVKELYGKWKQGILSLFCIEEHLQLRETHLCEAISLGKAITGYGDDLKQTGQFGVAYHISPVLHAGASEHTLSAWAHIAHVLGKIIELDALDILDPFGSHGRKELSETLAIGSFGLSRGKAHVMEAGNAFNTRSRWWRWLLLCRDWLRRVWVGEVLILDSVIGLLQWGILIHEAFIGFLWHCLFRGWSFLEVLPLESLALLLGWFSFIKDHSDESVLYFVAGLGLQCIYQADCGLIGHWEVHWRMILKTEALPLSAFSQSQANRRIKQE